MAKEWTNGFYTSKEWRKTRDAYYRIQCGRCERCMAEVLAGARRVEDINPGIIVHHKKELTPENINDPAVALSFDNLELLCDEHHNRQHKANACPSFRRVLNSSSDPASFRSSIEGAFCPSFFMLCPPEAEAAFNEGSKYVVIVVTHGLISFSYKNSSTICLAKSSASSSSYASSLQY